jgi:hypothetical protein
MSKGCGCEDEKKPNGFFTAKSLVSLGKSVINYVVNPRQSAFVTETELQSRLEACRHCEMLEESVGGSRCGICKCFVEMKAKLIDQECPHPDGSKWKNSL